MMVRRLSSRTMLGALAAVLLASVNDTPTFPNPLALALIDWEEAKRELNHAQQNYDNADPEYVNIAMSDLSIARERANNALRKVKMLQAEASRV